ncbi:MAG TPA: ribosome biogenesis factor YjgA [Burkholderiales bacterium]|nr:ribosome biogenesis factor YjgA [Burkholderiales bacterium]
MKAFPEDVEVSRTQRKREDQALQVLGEELVSISADKLAELDLPERLRDAVIEARNISRFGALRRQMQYIGRLMREEGDAEAIREKLAAWKGASVEQTARLHLIERWRERLLADDKTFEALIVEFPHANLQQLRTLARNAKREAEAGKPPKSFRELFQVLRETLNSTPGKIVDAEGAEEKQESTQRKS